MNNYCNNCGKNGHLYHQCKLPITSLGIIAFRINDNQIQYLMIRRKDTLGYIDFMRGKYSVFNKDYIINMLKQMTMEEKDLLITSNFDILWNRIWGNFNISNQYKAEENISREKYNSLMNGILFKNDFYNLKDLVEESNKYDTWNEAEWGFPKGRRNYQETDFECALREFAEETGYNIKHIKNVKNILPFEEVFTGSNYKSYKHKYYLTFMENKNTLFTDKFEPTEVSKMEWKNFDECMHCIRHYNLEKKRLLININETLKSFRLFYH
uniref:Nudix hydrolase domain-containing protein n=1 Tax=viral metagenome TaxID=1070528 RepID=A0A6C0JLK2_9ZZZZ